MEGQAHQFADAEDNALILRCIAERPAIIRALKMCKISDFKTIHIHTHQLIETGKNILQKIDPSTIESGCEAPRKFLTTRFLLLLRLPLATP